MNDLNVGEWVREVEKARAEERERCAKAMTTDSRRMEWLIRNWPNWPQRLLSRGVWVFDGIDYPSLREAIDGRLK